MAANARAFALRMQAHVVCCHASTIGCTLAESGAARRQIH